MMPARGGWPNSEASRQVQAAGLRWHVQILGVSGPVCLLLHGTGAATHSWAALAPLLATRFQVVAPDLPGHGHSELGTPAQQSLAGMAAAVAELMRVLELPPALVVGHSAGAAVLARAVLDGSLSPAALVAINGALLPFDGLMGRVFPAAARWLAGVPALPRLIAWRAARSPLVEQVIAQTGSPPQATVLAQYRDLASTPRHIQAVLQMMANWDLPGLERDLPRLNIPLHLLACSNDRAVPPAQARYLATRLDRATLHPLAGLGHLGHEEAPQRVADCIVGIAQEMGLRLAAGP